MNNKTPWWQGRRGEWYVVVQGLLFLLVAFGPRSLPGIPEWPSAAQTVGLVIGGLLIAVGGILAGTGLLSLGRNLSPYPHPLDDAEFVRRGPYRVVRHPIYSGIILAAFGWAGVVQGTLTLVYAAVLLVFFDLKTRREERWLMKKFPGYQKYRNEVKKLLPFIY